MLVVLNHGNQNRWIGNANKTTRAREIICRRIEKFLNFVSILKEGIEVYLEVFHVELYDFSLPPKFFLSINTPLSNP